MPPFCHIWTLRKVPSHSFSGFDDGRLQLVPVVRSYPQNSLNAFTLQYLNTEEGSQSLIFGHLISPYVAVDVTTIGVCFRLVTQQSSKFLLIFFLSNAYCDVFRQPAASRRRCHTAFDDRWGTSHGMRMVKERPKGDPGP